MEWKSVIVYMVICWLVPGNDCGVTSQQSLISCYRMESCAGVMISSKFHPGTTRLNHTSTRLPVCSIFAPECGHLMLVCIFGSHRTRYHQGITQERWYKRSQTFSLFAPVILDITLTVISVFCNAFHSLLRFSRAASVHRCVSYHPNASR
jgi:hypothetical protein